jgi:DNA-binding MarR family transcriptional regulator
LSRRIKARRNQKPADRGLSPGAPDPVLLAIERSWTRLARIPTRSRSYGLVLARAGLFLERSAYPILACLKDLGSVRMTELADAIGIDLSTLSRQVAVLERRKLVVRAVDPSDARVRTLRPTESGASALGKIAEAHQLFIGETLTEWTQSDREALCQLMERLATDAERYLEDQVAKTSLTAARSRSAGMHSRDDRRNRRHSSGRAKRRGAN